ncbi:hypothetical protein [Streptomyces rapamycinicus]|uniref:Transposase n=2 Tax=Streptomyces rapamycinicus TaxID=1226757 RepID=A0A3L8RSH4_STRRN|nr:hypothetical protein [Streptomyces rapamycinicus]RLV81990.1 transposase [Streptomyces rapamycinicus NRRL 5491]
MSQSAVSRIWRAFGLKPHIVETWKLSTDPQFVTKVRDVVGIYLAPPENACGKPIKIITWSLRDHCHGAAFGGIRPRIRQDPASSVLAGGGVFWHFR